MFEFVLLGVLLALLFKRNPLTTFKNLRFQDLYLVFMGLGIQIVLEMYIERIPKEVVTAFLVGSFLLVLWGLYENLKIKGLKWIFVGGCLNLLALLVHRGAMPVNVDVMNMLGISEGFEADSRHQALGESWFWWLGDNIPWVVPFMGNYVLSIGDVLVGIGLALLVFKNSSKWETVTYHESENY